MLSDFISHVVTNMPVSKIHSINTDVGPDVGHWLNTNQNYSAHLIRVFVEVVPTI